MISAPRWGEAEPAPVRHHVVSAPPSWAECVVPLSSLPSATYSGGQAAPGGLFHPGISDAHDSAPPRGYRSGAREAVSRPGYRVARQAAPSAWATSRARDTPAAWRYVSGALSYGLAARGVGRGRRALSLRVAREARGAPLPVRRGERRIAETRPRHDCVARPPGGRWINPKPKRPRPPGPLEWGRRLEATPRRPHTESVRGGTGPRSSA